MKKIILISLFGMSAQALIADTSGQTFFSVRAPFQTCSPEKITLFRNDRAQRFETGWRGALQLVAFGGQSTNEQDLARFFMPFDKSMLIFAEDTASGGGIPPAVNPLFRDVIPYFFDIISAPGTPGFKSAVAFKPQQTYAGIGIDWIQFFGWDPCEKRWWIELSFPFLYVKNDMRLTEVLVNEDFEPLNDGINISVKEAFTGIQKLENQFGAVTGSGWMFGKIDGARHETGIGDIEFKLGYDWTCDYVDGAYGYVGLVIPTGNTPTGEFVFEPVVGNNHHFGVMWGGSLYSEFLRCPEKNRTFYSAMDFNGRYLFTNRQTRSFDLYDKQWSRYQSVYRSFSDAVASAAFEGINVFTQRVHVSPRFTINFNSAIGIRWCHWEIEAGSNFWGRQCEKVKLFDPFPTGIALTSAPPVAASVNRAITIREAFNGSTVGPLTAQEYNSNSIQPGDLNLSSAAHPSTVSNILYASVGYNWDGCKRPMFVGIGGGYEFASDNLALERIVIWAKWGISL
ncbi:MAG TPA: hypothetical protein VHO47_00440 [Candidatus Babeliales bacterium]|nr:hypothetical protein [Candidatus Babeliales bacterium]